MVAGSAGGAGGAGAGAVGGAVGVNTMVAGSEGSESASVGAAAGCQRTTTCIASTAAGRAVCCMQGGPSQLVLVQLELQLFGLLGQRLQCAISAAAELMVSELQLLGLLGQRPHSIRVCVEGAAMHGSETTPQTAGC
jgi:hypothetical protein